MKVLVSGSSGFVGKAVVAALGRQGHTVCRLVRPQSARGNRESHGGAPSPTDIPWDPLSGTFARDAAEGADAVVHLAGASIAEGRWTEERKALLCTSRVDASRHLVGELSKLSRPPKTVVSASAVGFYGNRGDEELTEQSKPGTDFLASLARDWEAEVARAQQFGARTVMLRFGVILDREGGALARMLPPFKLGVGGRLGSGNQWMSWLSRQESVGLIQYALENGPLDGAVNAIAPHPVRNREFTAALANALHRPAIFPAPAWVLRLALGEMADALLLSSQRVLPAKLLSLGYRFQHPQLPPALATILNQPA